MAVSAGAAGSGQSQPTDDHADQPQHGGHEGPESPGAHGVNTGGGRLDRDGVYHGCFLEVFALVNERNQELARTFDDPRRSNATLLLAGMMERRLLSGEEFSHFSPQTRDAVEAILRIRAAASTSR